jgi:hypothetical protein
VLFKVQFTPSVLKYTASLLGPFALRSALSWKMTPVYLLVSIANCTKGNVAVLMGPAFAQPYVSMEGAAGLPDVASASAETGPGAVPPTLIAAIVTFAACVFAAGKGGEVPAYPANVHCAIVKPHTGEGPGGAVLTVNVSVALFPVSNVPMNRFAEVFV